jgi:hypothetical protein
MSSSSLHRRSNLLVTVVLLACGLGPATQQRATAQAPERAHVRVIFLGGDGQVIELPGRLPKTRGERALLSPGREIDALPGWVVLEREPLGRGFLGAGFIDLTPELRRHYGAPADRGVMVSAIAEDSPAERADLAVGDIVLQIERAAIASADVLGREIRARRDGDRVELDLLRRTERLRVVAELSERERPLIRLEPSFVTPGQLELRVDRLDRSGELVEIRIEELVDQVQRILRSGEALAGPVRARRGMDRDSIENRMREVERELEELDRALRRAEAEPR